MKRLSTPLISFAALAIIYLLLGLLLPPNTPTLRSYNLSVTEYKVLVLFISLPILVVWFAAFYGYGRLQDYAALVKKASDGQPFIHIANGLKVLAWGLPISSIISTVMGGIVHSHPGAANVALVVVHYIGLLVALVAFSFIATGCRRLTELARLRPSDFATRCLVAVFTVIGVLFTYLTIHGVVGHDHLPFYLPVWLILFTIIAPYLYAWYMGLFAAYEMFLYSRRTTGIIYRRPLSQFASGLVLAIVTSILFQYLQSDTNRLRRISFNWLFIVVYLLLIIYALGFILISRGATRLKKIEEV